MKQGTKSLFEKALNKTARSITLIEDGFSNLNYNVNNSYVMRVPKENKDETISYKDEKTIYELIDSLNISDKIAYFDENTGVKITKIIHASRKYFETPTNEEINYVAKALKKLHNSKIESNIGYKMFYRLKIYKNGVDKEVFINPRFENNVIKEVKKIFAKDPFVMCHNDLVHNNLLFKDKDVKLIDWEYGGMNNPYFDLASFISENDLSAEQADYFLSRYFGSKLNQQKRKKVQIFINFLDVLFYYWGLYLYKKRGDRVYYTIALHKLDRINETIKKERS